jgi:hypothetical protein
MCTARDLAREWVPPKPRRAITGHRAEPNDFRKAVARLSVHKFPFLEGLPRRTKDTWMRRNCGVVERLASHASHTRSPNGCQSMASRWRPQRRQILPQVSSGLLRIVRRPYLTISEKR